MKLIIYKNRVISALLLYLFTLLLIMYLYTHISNYFIWIIMLPIAFLNKKILGNGADLNSKDKILLIVGGVIMAGAFLFFTYNMAINKIINK